MAARDCAVDGDAAGWNRERRTHGDRGENERRNGTG